MEFWTFEFHMQFSVRKYFISTIFFFTYFVYSMYKVSNFTYLRKVQQIEIEEARKFRKIKILHFGLWIFLKKTIFIQGVSGKFCDNAAKTVKKKFKKFK